MTKGDSATLVVSRSEHTPEKVIYGKLVVCDDLFTLLFQQRTALRDSTHDTFEINIKDISSLKVGRPSPAAVRSFHKQIGFPLPPLLYYLPLFFFFFF